MDPNQTLIAQTDPNTGQPLPAAGDPSQSAPTGADPSQTSAPVDPSQAAPAGTSTDTSSSYGSSTYSSTGTDTMSGTTASTGTPTTEPAMFLGIPIDSLVVGAPLFIAGVLVFAWLTGRQPHTEQLSRLDKQRKRIEARDQAKPESVDIFAQEKEDFLGKLLSQAGLESQYDKMKTNWILAVIGTTVGMVVICLFQAPVLMPFSIVLGPGLGSFGFVQYIKWQGGERQKRLTAQLPQVLETMVSTLKAGSPVVECFKLLAETAPEPIRSEFRRGLVSLQLGKPFRDVLAEMGTRIRTADFKLLTQAIFISQDVGANLADVVATIAEAIRERFRLRDFLNSLTAQGKMTALFIGSLPYFITAMTYVMAPGYITPFLNHPIARIIFIGMMIWEAIGAYILVKMTTFEV
ncbi:MAG: type II secretion system F family protein [Candidatus Obscuribacterales bacterium]|nr:type II secretion system F family protein [Candidatus Obscuribacterales bacterium]